MLNHKKELFKQSGYNPNYPDIVEIWTWGELIPEWLSDRAKIDFIDGEGNITLGVINTNTGGIQIFDSTGKKTLVTLKNLNDILIFNINFGILSLTKKQFELLYEKKI